MTWTLIPPLFLLNLFSLPPDLADSQVPRVEDCLLLLAWIRRADQWLLSYLLQELQWVGRQALADEAPSRRKRLGLGVSVWWGSLPLCSPGWPRIHGNPPVSASWVWESWVCTPAPRPMGFLFSLAPVTWQHTRIFTSVCCLLLACLCWAVIFRLHTGDSVSNKPGCLAVGAGGL